MSKSVYDREKRFLDRLYRTYKVQTSPHAAAMRRLTVRTFAPFLKRGIGLELGCSDGLMTEMLAAKLERLDVVDGSRKFLRKASQRQLSNVRFIYSLFEEFKPGEQYDFVFGTYILEHVLDPVVVLRMARAALKTDGMLFLVVPNARALSRQLALHMGLIEDLKALTENDHDHGHRRVYDRAALNRDIEAAGFEPVSQGGILLKILADFQMDQLQEKGILTNAHLDGLYRLGVEHPDLCGALFSICKPRA